MGSERERRERDERPRGMSTAPELQRYFSGIPVNLGWVVGHLARMVYTRPNDDWQRGYNCAIAEALELAGDLADRAQRVSGR